MLFGSSIVIIYVHAGRFDVQGNGSVCRALGSGMVSIKDAVKSVLGGGTTGKPSAGSRQVLFALKLFSFASPIQKPLQLVPH